MGRRGFTLIELLIVLAIVIIMAGAMTPIIRFNRTTAMEARTRADLDAIKTAAIMCNYDTGNWPGEAADGEDIITNDSAWPNWGGPYLDDWRLDAYGQAYQIMDSIASPNQRFAVSGGPDDVIAAAAFPDVTSDDIYIMITPDHTL